MIADSQTIAQYIPHRHPVVMIDNLLSADDTHAITTKHIRSTDLFVGEEDRFEEPGLIENIAQTAAAQLGYVCVQKGIALPAGYIAAVKDLRIQELPKSDSIIRTEVKVKSYVLGLTLIEGTVSVGDQLICSCEMRIFTKTE